LERVRKFLTLARERFKLCEEAEFTNRAEALDDLKFRTGEQWPNDIQTQRVTDGRPCLTMNRIPQFVRQVTNEQRQQRPAIQVNPVGEGASIEVAEILQGMIRHIEYRSNADIVYDGGFEPCVIGGFGYWRLITEYLDGKSFDQEILLKRIKNPFTVYFDPTCAESDYSDARFAFIIEDLTAEEYKVQHPDSTLASLVEFSSIGNQAPGWASKETIRIAEYWHVEETKRELVRLEGGDVLDRTEYDQIQVQKPPVVASRDVLDRRVMWSKINALEILEEREWPGTWIGIIPVLGDDLDVNGKRYLAGLVRNAKDPQRMYNYWISAATEVIALAPKAPYVGAEGQFEGHEGIWKQANVRNLAYLEYKPMALGGQAVPPPQRQVFEPPVQAIALMTRQADNDLKATMGLYDASLGQRGPEQSGKAILARQQQGSIATMNFADNLARAIRATGRLLIDLIPRIYDAPRVQRIINPDQSVKRVGVYNSKTSGVADAQTALGMLQDKTIQKIYDVGTGIYDVTVSTGLSYQSKRQEAVASMMGLVQAYPTIMGLVGDLLVRQMDWPYAQEIADRLKKSLPPNLQEPPDDQDPAAVAQTLRQQLQVMMQQHEALVGELNQISEVVRTKKLELESRERIGALQVQAQLMMAEAKIQGEAGLAMLKAMIADVQQRLTLLNEDKPVGGDGTGAPTGAAAVPMPPAPTAMPMPASAPTMPAMPTPAAEGGMPQ
jgi:hypothetical protein